MVFIVSCLFSWVAFIFTAFTQLETAYCLQSSQGQVPLVINTWNFVSAAQRAWNALNLEDGTAIDAVEKGCRQCELDQCDFTVGFGGSPDENGETTLDAMIMDGSSFNIGAVAGLRNIKNAISVARKVMDNTKHTLLAGSLATRFAVQMGFLEEDLSTTRSNRVWEIWRNNNCQPNFWKNVKPNPSQFCGPYEPLRTRVIATAAQNDVTRMNLRFGRSNHDTIGMIVIDGNGRISCGTSTNGASHKIPGRTGDSPIPGAGAYCDQLIGGAAATGDGDVMMRFLPSYQSVENLRNGMEPRQAAEESLKRIIRIFPKFSGAVVVANITGHYGAACSGLDSFPFCVRNIGLQETKIMSVPCLTS